MQRDEEFKFCLLISVGVFTGRRIGDLLNLKFCQLQGDILEIQEKKTGKTRRIKINPELKKLAPRLQVKFGYKTTVS